MCRYHGSATPKVAANAATRAEVFSWGLQHAHVDPGEVLRLVTQSSARAQCYSDEVEKLVEESPSPVKSVSWSTHVARLRHPEVLHDLDCRGLDLAALWSPAMSAMTD